MISQNFSPAVGTTLQSRVCGTGLPPVGARDSSTQPGSVTYTLFLERLVGPRRGQHRAVHTELCTARQDNKGKKSPGKRVTDSTYA